MLSDAVRYYVFLGEAVKGPCDVDQLKALEDAGAINGDTQCCIEGTEDWFSFSAI